ncbi:hypothetical protein Q8F55_003506 [Vanrija albida]|uniref:Protein kinase domain-containing protein n=1 Tax=Vanrija albida TaxID=181172 RepID=A0ABR3Q456_9TREE
MAEYLETPRGRLTSIGGWKLGKTLGRGAYAHVRLATHLGTGHQAACKILPALGSPRSWNQTLDAVEAHKEVVLLKAFTGAKIPGVVSIEGVVEECGWTYVFLSLHSSSLSSISPPLETREAIVVFRRLLRTLHALHELGVSHEDVKRANVLLEGLCPALADFGFSQFAPDRERVTSAGGTPVYSAPEKLKDGAYDPRASDVWSLGIMFLKMLRVWHPCFAYGVDQTSQQVVDAIVRGDAGWDWLPDDKRFAELMRGMLAHDPAERWTIPQILDHRYLRVRGADDFAIPLPSRRLSSRIVRPVPQSVVDDLCFLAYLKKSFFLCETSKKIEERLYNKERTWEKRWAAMLHGWERRAEMDWEDVPALRTTPSGPSRRRRHLPPLKEIRLSPVHKPKTPKTPRRPSPKQSRRRKSQTKNRPTTPSPLPRARPFQTPAAPGPKEMLWPPKRLIHFPDTPPSSVGAYASPLALKDRNLEHVNTKPRTKAQKAMRAVAAGAENQPFPPKKVLGPSAFGHARRPALGYHKKVTAMRPMVLSTEDDHRQNASAGAQGSPRARGRQATKPSGPRDRSVSTMSGESWATMTAANAYLALLEDDAPESQYAASTYTTAESDVASTIENWESTLDLSTPSDPSEPSSASTIVGHGTMLATSATSNRANRRHQLIDGSLLADLRAPGVSASPYDQHDVETFDSSTNEPRRRTEIPVATIFGLEETARALDSLPSQTPLSPAGTIQPLSPAETIQPLHSRPTSIALQSPPDTFQPLPSFSAAPDPLATPKPRRGSRLSINTDLPPPERPKSPEPSSPGLKHWQQVRHHVFVGPTPSIEKPMVVLEPKRPNFISKASARLGFRHAVEHVMGYEHGHRSSIGSWNGIFDLSEAEREEVARERRRFARDIKTCLDACALEESRRRLQRCAKSQIPDFGPTPGAGGSNSGPSRPWSLHHHHSGSSGPQSAAATPGVTPSTYPSKPWLLSHNSSAQHSTAGTEVSASNPSRAEFSAFAPLLTVLHNHLPSARSKKLWSRTCPHHSAILSELGITLLADAASSDSERIQALEVFGTVIRNWAADSADEELDRWLWLCRAMLVDDQQLRARGLDMLRKALHRDPSLPESLQHPQAANDFEPLAIGLLELLYSLDQSSSPNKDHQELVTSFVYELTTGSIINVQQDSLGELVGDLDSSGAADGIERELMWLAAGRGIAANPELAAWLLDRHAEELKRYAPPPILHATPPVVLKIRVIAATQFFSSFSTLIRTTDDEHLVESVTRMAEDLYIDSSALPDDNGAITSGYATVLLDLLLRHHAVSQFEAPPVFSDPFGDAKPRLPTTTTQSRQQLLKLIGGVNKRVQDGIITRLVTTYPLPQVLSAVRSFMESDLSDFGKACVPPVFERLTTSSAYEGIKPFLEWLSTTHPQVFYKPLFSLAAATQASSLAGPLRVVMTLQEQLGAESYWTRADPQMVVIVLVGTITQRSAKGKTKEGTHGVVPVKLGRYAVLVELLIALQYLDAKGVPALKAFVTTLETRFGTMLELEENEGEGLPASYRSLVCQLFNKLRVSSRWIKRTAATRLAAKWYEQTYKEVPGPAAVLDRAQLSFLRQLYFAEGKNRSTPRMALIDLHFGASTASFLITAQASLPVEAWSGMLPVLWESYTQPLHPMDVNSFLLLKCAEMVPDRMKTLVMADLSSTSSEIRSRALLKLGLLYAYRFQVTTQPTITEGRAPIFKFSRRVLDFVPTEIGSPQWTLPRDAQDVALEKYGRALPLELRQRLMELGWSEDASIAASDNELVPVTKIPPTEPTDDGGADKEVARPGTPTANPLTRTLSNSSEASTSMTTQVRRAIIPPALLTLIIEQAIHLQYTDDLAVRVLSDEVVRLLERDDAARFVRPVMDNLDDNLPHALERLNAVITDPTPSFAYTGLNAIVGYLKKVYRINLSHQYWALIVGTVARLIPHVSEISLRDFRKFKAEHLILPASILDDETGFRAHQAWVENLVEVQTAQLMVLFQVLRVNRRDVYIVKKMLVNLKVEGAVHHLPFARAWLELVVRLFSFLNSNYNDRTELDRLLKNISTMLRVHGSTDMIVVGQALRALTIASARFRRLFASIGFVDTMAAVYYVYAHANPSIRDAIEYACRSFFRIHQEVFVYQMCLGIAESPFNPEQAYRLVSSLSNEDHPVAGLASGIRGLNENAEITALLQMIGDGREMTFSEIGSEASERQARKAANISLYPAVFPRENIIRLIATVISVNAASPRAIKFLRLFTAILPHIVDEPSKELMVDAVDAIGRFVHRGKAGDDARMHRLLPGEEEAPPDWISADREYLALVDAFASQGGRLSINATRRVIDIVVNLLHSEPETAGRLASSIMGKFARTNLAAQNPIEFLRDMAPLFRQFIVTVDFSGVLLAIADMIRRHKYELTLGITQLIVTSYLEPAIDMLASASEEHMGFVVPMRKAVVELLGTSVFLANTDVIAALEQSPSSPGFLAGVVLPLCLLLEQPLDIDRAEAYGDAWVRILRYVLRASKRRTIRPQHATDSPPALAATAVISLQIIKVIAVRAPTCISRVRGLWTYISTYLREMIQDGNAKFLESGGLVPGSPRLVDWMMWSLFELLVLHPTPLHIDLRLRMQMALSAIQDGRISRPSTPGSDLPPTPIRSPFAHSQQRSFSGLVRKPSSRVAKSSPRLMMGGHTPPPTSPDLSSSPPAGGMLGPASPSHARNVSSASSHLNPNTPTHGRSVSNASSRLNPTSPTHGRSVSSASSHLNPNTPTHGRSVSNASSASPTGLRRLPSVSIRGEAGSTPNRPTFATLSAKRASRPTFDAFHGGPRHFRFPSNAGVRSLAPGGKGEKGGAIVHLLGPATQVIGATSANLGFTGSNEKSRGPPVDPTRIAIRDTQVRSPKLINESRRSVHVTMLVFGYHLEDGAEEPSVRVWSVPEALEAIAVQTRLLVEEELRHVFNPKHHQINVPELPVLADEPETIQEEKAAEVESNQGPGDWDRSHTYTDEPSFTFSNISDGYLVPTLEVNAPPDDAEPTPRPTLPVPILSVTQA